MEIVRLLLMCLGVFATIGAVYFIVAMLVKDQKSMTDEDIIKNTILNKCKNCKKCGKDSEQIVEDVIGGSCPIEELPCLTKQEKEELMQSLPDTVVSDPTKVAFISCRGGNHAAQNFIYDGAQTCACLNENFEGPKLCKSACLGCLDCAKVCPTGAIRKTKNNVAEVDRALCIGCGACTKVCPDNIIKMIPVDQEVAIACNIYSKYFGGQISEMCAVGCTSCNQCVKVCPTGALSSTPNGIKFDNSKCIKCFECVYACPSNTITRLNADSLTASAPKNEN